MLTVHQQLSIVLLAGLLALPLSSAVDIAPVHEVNPGVQPFIFVDGDDDLAEHPSVRAGSGSPQDPYVISDWFVSTAAGFAVVLRNTTAHVVLENITIEGLEGHEQGGVFCDLESYPCSGAVGIVLYGASNVTLRHVTVHSARSGVMVQESSNIVVEDARLGTRPESQSAVGVTIRDSDHVQIRRSVFAWAFVAVWIYSGSEIQVEDSRMSGAIRIVEAGSVVVRGNEFSTDGILVRDSVQSIQIIGNTFDAVHGAFKRARSSMVTRDVVIRGNIVTNATGMVFETIAAHNVEIIGNHVEGGRRAIYALSGQNLTATGNRFHGQSEMSFYAKVDNLTLHDNDLGTTAGVVLRSPNGNAIGNFWGSPTGPSREGTGTGISLRTEGNIAYEPWLAAPPPRDMSWDLPPPDTGAAGATTEIQVHSAA